MARQRGEEAERQATGRVLLVLHAYLGTCCALCPCALCCKNLESGRGRHRHSHARLAGRPREARMPYMEGHVRNSR